MLREEHLQQAFRERVFPFVEEVGLAPYPLVRSSCNTSLSFSAVAREDNPPLLAASSSSAEEGSWKTTAKRGPVRPKRWAASRPVSQASGAQREQAGLH